ncbi:MAG: CrcB family protein [Planctomycetota bacterium]|nr:CrcB family protein [Planctomycetota bacterium]MDA1113775.1 CrcB family protein [Planctomycetota bacterium]
MSRLLLLAAAGAAGTLARYGLSNWVRGWAGSGFPWGTLAVNAIGCFFFGAVLTLAREKGSISEDNAAWIMFGFLGAFTTFSAFAFESGDFLRNGAIGAAMLNVAANVIVGMGLFFAGVWIVRTAA